MTYPQPSGGFEWVQAPWGRVLKSAPLLAAAEHFFTARELTLTDGREQWLQVAALAGVSLDNLLLIKQAHGNTVAIATADRPRPWVRPEADAIITDDPDAAIGVRTADCVPILMADETGGVVAAVHAGWRGIAARVAIAAVRALGERFGVRPERLVAALGPAIGPCCYEVGEDTRVAFTRAGHHPALLERWFEPRPNGRFHLDTWRAAADQLEGAGVHPSRIHAAGLCTLTHADVFHSYRAAGLQGGRMVAVIRPRRRSLT